MAQNISITVPVQDVRRINKEIRALIVELSIKYREREEAQLDAIRKATSDIQFAEDDTVTNTVDNSCAIWFENEEGLHLLRTHSIEIDLDTCKVTEML